MVIIYHLLLFPNQLLGSSHIQVSFPLWFENIELFALMLKHHIEIFWLFLLCWLYDQKYLTQSLTLNVSDCMCLIDISDCFSYSKSVSESFWLFLSCRRYLMKTFLLEVSDWKFHTVCVTKFVPSWKYQIVCIWSEFSYWKFLIIWYWKKWYCNL